MDLLLLQMEKDRVCNQILGSLVVDTAQLIAGLILNVNVRVVPIDKSRYLQLFIAIYLLVMTSP